MNDYVLDALHRLLSEFEVQPEAPSLGVAGAPLRFHFFDPTFAHLNANNRLPFLEQWRDQRSQFLAIPPLQHAFALLRATFRRHMEFNSGSVAKHDRGR